jgi:hypothetical protein
MSINKTITTTRVEQLKSAVIVALVVGIAAFVVGMRYNSDQSITVDNNVVIQSQDVDTGEVTTPSK